MKQNELFEKYVVFRADPDNRHVDDCAFCTEHGITLAGLKSLKADHPDWQKRVLALSREQMVVQLLFVDDGLLAKAKVGDVKAAEILYERLEGFVRQKTPVQVGVMVNLAGALKDAYERNDARRTIEAPKRVEERPSSVRE